MEIEGFEVKLSGDQLMVTVDGRQIYAADVAKLRGKIKAAVRQRTADITVPAVMREANSFRRVLYRGRNEHTRELKLTDAMSREKFQTEAYSRQNVEFYPDGITNDRLVRLNELGGEIDAAEQLVNERKKVLRDYLVEIGVRQASNLYSARGFEWDQAAMEREWKRKVENFGRESEQGIGDSETQEARSGVS